MITAIGCRLAVTYPEIAVMQTKAVIKAAIAVQKRHPDWNVVPEIMIPLVGDVKELKFCKKTVVETADDIAKEAEFFCFGTNDLTQMTFGFSRDDASKFLPSYYQAKIYESDPFARLDTTGVGKLMKMAVEMGHSTRKDIHCNLLFTLGYKCNAITLLDYYNYLHFTHSVNINSLKELINL